MDQYLQTIHLDQESMIQTLENWVCVNSSSDNPLGLQTMVQMLKSAFSSFNVPIKEIQLPHRKVISDRGITTEHPGSQALYLCKNLEAPVRIFLGGHFDTVYPIDSKFQNAKRLDQNTLQGPGTADMKGGLLILLKALEIFDASPYSKQIGWEVLLSPDEEIGSPGTTPYLEEIADRVQLALIFEPSFPDGSIVSARKGSLNFTIIAKGVSAHSGRDFLKGKNAITALARFALAAESLVDHHRGITINVGSFTGGGPVNIVPDLAICQVNVRVQNNEDIPFIKNSFQEIIDGIKIKSDVELQLMCNSERGVKLFDQNTENFFLSLKECAKDLGYPLEWQPSGGVCDGNIFGAQGVPTIDSIGAIGGGIHTHNEYILLDSLISRVRLVSYLLMKIATNKGYQINQ